MFPQIGIHLEGKSPNDIFHDNNIAEEGTKKAQEFSKTHNFILYKQCNDKQILKEEGIETEDKAGINKT
jgi:hypothetical protein